MKVISCISKKAGGGLNHPQVCEQPRAKVPVTHTGILKLVVKSGTWEPVIIGTLSPVMTTLNESQKAELDRR